MNNSTLVKRTFNDASVKIIIDMWENDKWKGIEDFDTFFSLMSRTEQLGAIALQYEIDSFVRVIKYIDSEGTFQGTWIALIQEMILHLGKNYNLDRIKLVFDEDFILSFIEVFAKLTRMLDEQEDNIGAIENICSMINFYFIAKYKAPFHLYSLNIPEEHFVLQFVPFPIEETKNSTESSLNQICPIEEWRESIKQWGNINKKAEAINKYRLGFNVKQDCNPFSLFNELMQDFDEPLFIEMSKL